MIKVRSDEVACDPAQRPRVLTAANDAFSSPNFPDIPYPNDAWCEWRISATGNQMFDVRDILL